jgi:hypothetical protein
MKPRSQEHWLRCEPFHKAKSVENSPRKSSKDSDDDAG